MQFKFFPLLLLFSCLILFCCYLLFATLYLKNMFKDGFLSINLHYNIAHKFVSSNSIVWACFIFLLCTLMTSEKKSLEKKFFTTFKPSGWKCYKTIGSYISCAFIEIWSTCEVWRAFKKLELLSAMPRATLVHLSCSPNFPHASYLDERTLTNEPIVNFIKKEFFHKYKVIEDNIVFTFAKLPKLDGGFHHMSFFGMI